MTLSLPIVVGKKYVRRDGVVITANNYAHTKFSKEFAQVNRGSEPQDDSHAVYLCDGRVWQAEETGRDIVADYIEPAKPLTIEHFGEIKEDAYGRLGFHFFRTSGDGGDNPILPLMDACIERLQKAKEQEIERIAKLPKPDPHAESAAEYAKDMAVSDKAWERWQAKAPNWNEWQDLVEHPGWHVELLYRRKEQS